MSSSTSWTSTTRSRSKTCPSSWKSPTAAWICWSTTRPSPSRPTAPFPSPIRLDFVETRLYGNNGACWYRAVVVVQLVERSLPTSEVHISNPIIAKLLCTVNCNEKTKLKKQRPGMAHFSKNGTRVCWLKLVFVSFQLPFAKNFSLKYNHDCLKLWITTQ